MRCPPAWRQVRGAGRRGHLRGCRRAAPGSGSQALWRRRARTRPSICRLRRTETPRSDVTKPLLAREAVGGAAHVHPGLRGPAARRDHRAETHGRAELVGLIGRTVELHEIARPDVRTSAQRQFERVALRRVRLSPGLRVPSADSWPRGSIWMSPSRRRADGKVDANRQKPVRSHVQGPVADQVHPQAELVRFAVPWPLRAARSRSTADSSAPAPLLSRFCPFGGGRHGPFWLKSMPTCSRRRFSAGRRLSSFVSPSRDGLEQLVVDQLARLDHHLVAPGARPPFERRHAQHRDQRVVWRLVALQRVGEAGEVHEVADRARIAPVEVQVDDQVLAPL